MDILLNYSLIGIGEFSPAIQESWEFRFKLLKYAIRNTNKKIIIFSSISNWRANNIVNNTIWSVDKQKPIKYDGIKIDNPSNDNDFIGGKLWHYIPHFSDSKIFLQIIKYIRKHKKRLTIIGITIPEIKDEYYTMYKIIMKRYKQLVYVLNLVIFPLIFYFHNYNHNLYVGFHLFQLSKFVLPYLIINLVFF